MQMTMRILGIRLLKCIRQLPKIEIKVVFTCNCRIESCARAPDPKWHVLTCTYLYICMLAGMHFCAKCFCISRTQEAVSPPLPLIRPADESTILQRDRDMHRGPYTTFYDILPRASTPTNIEP